MKQTIGASTSTPPRFRGSLMARNRLISLHTEDWAVELVPEEEEMFEVDNDLSLQAPFIGNHLTYQQG